jgi:hypothetical protein
MPTLTILDPRNDKRVTIEVRETRGPMQAGAAKTTTRLVTPSEMVAGCFEEVEPGLPGRIAKKVAETPQ